MSGTTKLTVNGQALFITIAFGNTIADLDTTTYSKPFTVYVTDADGVAVANQNLTLSVLPETYEKGFMTYVGATWSNQNTTPPVCPNEDLNRNGILDGTEDTNTNGKLTPGNVAVVVPGLVKTDSNGRVAFELQYGKPYATWVTVRIFARATVAGTESSQSVQMRLPIALVDISDADIPPAGVISPFGTAGVCANKD